MATYWLSFRIEDNRTYAQRYEALVDAVRQVSTKWWVDTTAFLVFESSSGIDAIAAAVEAAVDTSVDVVLIGMTDFKSARILGNNQDNDIFAVIPFLKTA